MSNEISATKNVPQNNFAVVMNQMRKEGKMVDIFFNISNRRFGANRVVLLAAVKAFRTKLGLRENIGEQQEISINEKLIHPDIFEELLDYIYIGEIKLTVQNVENFAHTAHYLEMNELLSSAEKFLISEVNFNNMYHQYFLSKRLNLPNLGKICLKKIIDDRLSRSSEHIYPDCADQLKFFFQDIGQEVEDKKILFEILFGWIRCDEMNRKRNLFELMKTIPLILVPRTFIYEHVLTDPLIMENHECLKELCKTFKKHTSSKLYIIGNRRSGGKTNKGEELNGGMIVLDSVDHESVFSSSIPSFGERFFAAGAGSTIYLFDRDHRAILQLQHTENVWKTNSSFGYLSVASGFITSADYGLIILTKRRIYCWRDWTPHQIEKNHKIVEIESTRCKYELVLMDDCLYVLGGCLKPKSPMDSLCNLVEKLDFRQKEWTQLEPMTNPMINFSAIAFKHKIYIAKNQIFEVYNPETNEWTALPSTDMTEIRLAIFEGQLIAVGKREKADPTKLYIERFDFEDSIWKSSHVIDGFDLENYRVVTFD